MICLVASSSLFSCWRCALRFCCRLVICLLRICCHHSYLRCCDWDSGRYWLPLGLQNIEVTLFLVSINNMAHVYLLHKIVSSHLSHRIHMVLTSSLYFLLFSSSNWYCCTPSTIDRELQHRREYFLFSTLSSFLAFLSIPDVDFYSCPPCAMSDSSL